ncbi:MAG: 3-phosphoshikimate 1-carboxyvinyltransferase [Flavobacterium sp.]|nr:MAG: 3-phosphoshikimate 1-carboxyvinyltransferase [Flavobacterium sp.]
MDLKLSQSKVVGFPAITISGSKSETNRLLLLQAIIPELTLQNISESDDSRAMQNALTSDSSLIDIGHAGTAMRFLTAYFAVADGRVVTLTGSSRMKQRPIKILVDALRELGAQIDYLESDGFPPLKISGKKLTKHSVSLDAGVSSQYISALLLIAPKLENGLELTLTGEVASRPYIEMTLSLLNDIGVKTSFVNNMIAVANAAGMNKNSLLVVESDWSSASYFYSIVALSDIGTQIELSTFKNESRQGDSALAEIYKTFGVETDCDDVSIIIRKSHNLQSSPINLRLNNTPDLAQTIAVTAFGLGIKCTLAGLHTLKIKETDRISALKAELEKLGAAVSTTDESITIESSEIRPNVRIKTYDDHRMAMAFAPLAVKVPILIENSEVVSKSYPSFWSDIKVVGFIFEEA